MMASEGPGVRADRARQWRNRTIMGALALAGAAVGFVSALLEKNPGPGFLQGTLPAAWAIAAAAILIIAITWGCWRLSRTVDELERRNNYLAGTMGYYAFAGTYMVWFVLWRGDLVPEPSHQLLFLITMIAAFVTYFWKKLRP